MGFRYYAVRDMKASGFDTLSIVVFLMCKEARGADDSIVSKFAAECVQGNLTPWGALAELRHFIAEEYLDPEVASAVHRQLLDSA